MNSKTNLKVREIVGCNVDDIAKNISPRIATVVDIDDSGTVFIDFSGNISERLVAMLALSNDDLTILRDDYHDLQVLILFENNDARYPIITGLVTTKLENIKIGTVSSDVKLDQVFVDGRKQVIKADEELILACGKSSITLKKNGKVIVRGTDIVSRSSGGNKIRGAAVKIN